MRIEEVAIMTTKGKIFRFGMVGLALILGLALAGCKQQVYEYEGVAYGDEGGVPVLGTTILTVTLTKDSYRIEWHGNTGEGDAEYTSNLKPKSAGKKWKFTSGCLPSSPNWAIALVASGRLKITYYSANYGPGAGWMVSTIKSSISMKKAVDGNEYDVEVIFIDETGDED
jgi:hypothetical protein